jgi:hypothetical protein
MNSLSISRLIFDTIPQLYEGSHGPYPVDLRIAGEDARVYSLVELSPELKRYLARATEIWEELRPMTEGEISQIIEREWVQQKFVVDWLEARTPIKSWGRILDYSRRLSRRLTENQVMSKTIMIEPGEGAAQAGLPGVSLSDPDYFKVFDWLGTSPYTYFRVDEQLRIKAFEALPYLDAGAPESFRFYPDFLHPVISSIKMPGAVIVHLSENGSILIADRDGLIASKRSLESWTIYDIDHILASVGEIVKQPLKDNACCNQAEHVSCSLFQVLFDISMKRHGALILIDHPDKLPAYVIKGIERHSDSPLSALFAHAPSNELLYSIPEVRKLVELSSIDGAVVLDMHGSLLQVGSMIVSHPSTPNRFGTREAAAFSAAKNGAIALKVSADGDMSIFFTTPQFTSDEVHRFDFR